MRWLDSEDLYYLTVVALFQLANWSGSPRFCDALANTVAGIAWMLPSAKQRHMLSRIAACFDGATPKQRQEIAQRTYRAFWQDAFVLAAPVRRADAQRIRVQGLEHLQHALAKGHGALLLESSFLGRRNLAKVALHARGVDIVQVHASDHLAGFWSRRETRVRRDVIRPFLEARELQFVREIVRIARAEPSLAFTRRLMSVLQDNRVLCLSGEGRIGQKTVLVRFLAEERRFATGAMSLAKHSGAPLLPLFCWRDPDGEVTLVIEAPIDVATGARAAEAGTAAYIRLLDSYVRRYPSEYYGWHIQS
jgi:KDO2-lipid IV(A) lauroyltransferase